MQFIFIILSLFLKSFLDQIDIGLLFCCKAQTLKTARGLP